MVRHRLADLVDAREEPRLRLLLVHAPHVGILQRRLERLKTHKGKHTNLVLAVLVKHGHTTSSEVVEEEPAGDEAPSPTTCSKCVTSPPQRVPAVVDVPRPAKQTARVKLALVLGLLLEGLALSLGNGLEKHADNVESRSNDKGSSRPALPAGSFAASVGDRGSLGDEEQGVDGVEYSVEGRDLGCILGRHLFVANEELPKNLLGRGANGHAEEGKTVRGESEGINHGEAGVGDRTLAEDLAADALDNSRAKFVAQKGVLQEWIQGAEANEDAAAGRRGSLVAMDIVLVCQAAFDGHCGGNVLIL